MNRRQFTAALGAGITAFRSYGSSEHPTVTTGTIADPLDLRAGTDGGLLAGNQVRLVDAAGRDVPEGGEGEILTRGPELFTGYTDPALNAASPTTKTRRRPTRSAHRPAGTSTAANTIV